MRAAAGWTSGAAGAGGGAASRWWAELDKQRARAVGLPGGGLAFDATAVARPRLHIGKLRALLLAALLGAPF
eukprot:8295962-Alexandrium_andersonii.AAC.1